MQIITTVTQKGQLTIPKELRDKLKIEEYTKVLLKAEKDYLKVIPTQDILELAGTYKPPKNKPIGRAREQMEKKYKRV